MLLLLALLVACGGPATPVEQPSTAPVSPAASEQPAPSVIPSSTPTTESVTSVPPSASSTADTPAQTATATSAAEQSSGQIAYVKEGNLWLLDLATSEMRQLTTDGENSDPAWSPDGQTLAFMRLYEGNPEIATMRADGSDLTRVTNNPANDLHPAYARDGTLFYARHRQGEDSDMEIIKRDAAAKELVVYTQPGGLCTPVHLSVAEQTRLALSINCGRGYNAFAIDTTTNAVIDISLEYAPSGCVYQATWARSEPRLVLITAQNCSPQINAVIATLSTELSPPQLEERFANREIWAIDWSPDGRALVFHKESRADPDLSGLWLLPLDGAEQEPRQLTKEGTSPAWRP
jgi:dipeptidyl aminopeptidase/acylaminoacyl peptidase